MPSPEWTAALYLTLAVPTLVLQLGLALGAPWGRFAMGGRVPGRFPPRYRIGAVVQGALLAAVAYVVAGQGGLVGFAPPRALLYAVFALMTVSLVLNTITPSKGERLLWAPILALQVLCLVRLILGQ